MRLILGIGFLLLAPIGFIESAAMPIYYKVLAGGMPIAVGLTFCTCSERQYEKKEYVVSLKSFLINMACAVGVVLGLFIIFLLDFSDYIVGWRLRTYLGIFGLMLFGASFCGWLFTGAKGHGSLSHGGF